MRIIKRKDFFDVDKVNRDKFKTFLDNLIFEENN